MTATPILPTWAPPPTAHTQTGASTPPTVPFPRDIGFDWSTHDLRQDASGNVVRDADGHQSWIDWCLRAVLVQRFSCVLYDANYGMDWEGALALSPRSVAEAQLKTNLFNCLKANAQTADVQDISFTWEGDTVNFACTVISADAVRGQLSGSPILQHWVQP